MGYAAGVDSPRTSMGDYRLAGPLLFAAALLQRYLPRGKGSVPRWLGRRFGGSAPRFLLTKHGAKLAMSNDAYDIYATMKLGDDAWDYHDFKICLSALPSALQGKGTVFYDIGANVGYFSVEAAALPGEGIRVVAFEPQPSLVEAIRASVALNGLETLQVVDALVGDEDKDATLFLAPATIHTSAVEDSGRGYVRAVPKPMVKIDTLVADGTIPPPDFVKMDVEGSEHIVLRGAARTLRAHAPHLFLEYFADLDKGDRVRHEVTALLRDVPDYVLYGQPQTTLASAYAHTLFRVREERDWQRVHALFLRNVKRALRSPAMFEPLAG